MNFVTQVTLWLKVEPGQRQGKSTHWSTNRKLFGEVGFRTKIVFANRQTDRDRDRETEIPYLRTNTYCYSLILIFTHSFIHSYCHLFEDTDKKQKVVSPKHFIFFVSNIYATTLLANTAQMVDESLNIYQDDVCIQSNATRINTQNGLVDT